MVDPIRTIYSATRGRSLQHVYIKSALQMFKHGTRERACYREILYFYYGRRVVRYPRTYSQRHNEMWPREPSDFERPPRQIQWTFLAEEILSSEKRDRCES